MHARRMLHAATYNIAMRNWNRMSSTAQVSGPLPAEAGGDERQRKGPTTVLNSMQKTRRGRGKKTPAPLVPCLTVRCRGSSFLLCLSRFLKNEISLSAGHSGSMAASKLFTWNKTSHDFVLWQGSWELFRQESFHGTRSSFSPPRFRWFTTSRKSAGRSFPFTSTCGPHGTVMRP